MRRIFYDHNENNNDNNNNDSNYRHNRIVRSVLLKITFRGASHTAATPRAGR